METTEKISPVTSESLERELSDKIIEMEADALVEQEAIKKRKEKLVKEGADMAEGNADLNEKRENMGTENGRRLADSGLREIYETHKKKADELAARIEEERLRIERVKKTISEFGEELKSKGIDIQSYEKRIAEAEEGLQKWIVTLQELRKECQEIERNNDWVTTVQGQIAKDPAKFAAETIAGTYPQDNVDKDELRKQIEGELKTRKDEKTRAAYEVDQANKRKEDSKKMDEYEKILVEYEQKFQEFKKSFELEIERWQAELKSEQTAQKVKAAKEKIEEACKKGIFQFIGKDKKRKKGEEGIEELEELLKHFQSWGTRIHNMQAEFRVEMSSKYNDNILDQKVSRVWLESDDHYKKESEISKRMEGIEKKRDILIKEISNLGIYELDPEEEFGKRIASREEIGKYQVAVGAI